MTSGIKNWHKEIHVVSRKKGRTNVGRETMKEKKEEWKGVDV
jgi:hypothetical protein